MLRFCSDQSSASRTETRRTQGRIVVQRLRFGPILATLLSFSLAACAARNPGAQPRPTPTAAATASDPVDGSGVKGRVLIGPTCPVMTIGTECPDLPYEAELIVVDLNGEEIAEGSSDEDGHFQIQLPPGEYVLKPQTPNLGVPPHAGPIPFTVTEGAYTELLVKYDSGIR